MYNPGLIPQSQVKFVPKSWGWESWIVNFEKYCGKILFIKKGMFTSWHYHNIKEETLYIQEGQLEVYYGPNDDMLLASKIVLFPGDAFHITPGLRHRLGMAKIDTYLIEFSTQHFDEDSIRLTKN